MLNDGSRDEGVVTVLYGAVREGHLQSNEEPSI